MGPPIVIMLFMDHPLSCLAQFRNTNEKVCKLCVCVHLDADVRVAGGVVAMRADLSLVLPWNGGYAEVLSARRLRIVAERNSSDPHRTRWHN